MRRIREVLGSGTAVCCNGAVLLDLVSFSVLDEDPLHPEGLAGVAAELRRRQPGTRFAVGYGLESRHEPGYPRRWDAGAPGAAEVPLEELLRTPVAKLLARHEEMERD